MTQKLKILKILKNKYCLMFIYFERQSASWGGAERDRDTEWETGSRLRAVSTGSDAGLELVNREIVT